MNPNEAGRLAHAINDLLPGEQWRPIPGYERTYAVSSLGRIYSHPRPTTSGGVLKGSIDSYGYRRVALVQDGKQRTRRVHVLVMLAFRGPAPAGMEIRHLDGDKLNPRLGNLEYGTHQQNGMDTVAHGNCPPANRTHCPRNHPYDEANTLHSRGRRYCRACRKAGRK
jgi:hypothetical protein